MCMGALNPILTIRERTQTNANKQLPAMNSNGISKTTTLFAFIEISSFICACLYCSESNFKYMYDAHKKCIDTYKYIYNDLLT